VGVTVAKAGMVKVSVTACMVVRMLAGLEPANLVEHFCCVHVDGSLAVTRPLKNTKQSAKYALAMERLGMVGGRRLLVGSDSLEMVF
jgi:hypothetical protein